MRRELLLAIVALTILAGALAPVTAQTSNTSNSTATPSVTVTPTPTATQTPTTTPTPTPEPVETPESGPYSIDELTYAGKSEGVDTVKSIRALGDPPRGFVAARYRDPSLIDALMGSPGQWKDAQPTSVVERNKVQVYGSAFGEVAGEYEIVVVYWQMGTYQNANGTPEQYAANQSVQRHDFNLDEDELYSYENVTLQEHLGETWRVSMWLERDGEPVHERDVQWTFRHRSNPESSSIDIDSQAEAWGFSLRNVLLPGVGSLVAGLVLARLTLRKVGRGPGWGIPAWVFFSTLIFVIVGGIAYYQIAVILQNLPYTMGLTFGVVGYAAGLTFHEPVQMIGFFRRELSDIIRIPGGTPVQRVSDGGAEVVDAAAKIVNGDDGGAELFDEFTEAMFVDLPEVPVVRTANGYRVPVTGVRPFLARLFADAALLNLSNIATRTKVREGNLSDIIFVDPVEPEAIEHKPARLVRVLPWDTLPDDSEWYEQAWAAILTAGILIAPSVILFTAFDRLLNIGSVGVVAGIIVTVVIAYSAEDGWIDFTVAPPHYARAEDNLTVLQRAYQQSKEEQTAKEEARSERAMTAQRARADRMSERRTITDRVLGGMGFEGALPSGKGSDSGGKFDYVDDGDDDDDDDDGTAPKPRQ